MDAPAHAWNLKLVQNCKGMSDILPCFQPIPFGSGNSRIHLPAECSQIGIRNREDRLQKAGSLALRVPNILGAQVRLNRAKMGLDSENPVKEEFGGYRIVADRAKRLLRGLVILQRGFGMAGANPGDSPAKAGMRFRICRHGYLFEAAGAFE